MKRVELTVPLALLEDLGILGARFFENNESVEVLQTFSLEPDLAALIVRVRRAGPFKDAAAIRGEARSIATRYRLRRFEVLSADRERGEYLAWVEYRIPRALREILSRGWTGVVPTEAVRTGEGEARVALLASEAVLPRLRQLLGDFGAPYRVRAVRSAPAGAWQPLAGLTPRQRELLGAAFRLGYYASPAKISLEEIGSRAGVSRAAVSKNLRAAERKILAAVLGEGRRSP